MNYTQYKYFWFENSTGRFWNRQGSASVMESVDMTFKLRFDRLSKGSLGELRTSIRRGIGLGPKTSSGYAFSMISDYLLPGVSAFWDKNAEHLSFSYYQGASVHVESKMEAFIESVEPFLSLMPVSQYRGVVKYSKSPKSLIVRSVSGHDAYTRKFMFERWKEANIWTDEIRDAAMRIVDDNKTLVVRIHNNDKGRCDYSVELLGD